MLPDGRVFEYGSGMSTLFWAARTARVVTSKTTSSGCRR
jgi:hypothetical protein